MLIRPRTRRVIGIAMLVVIAAVSAAFVGTGVGITKIPVNQKGSGGAAAICSVGQLDFSNGCNTTLLMVILR